MANGSMRRREFLPERSRRKESEAMGRSSALLTWLACAVAQAQPMYFTIVSHNEEPNQRQPDYLDREFYLRNRGLLRRMAMIIHEKGAMLNFQSDWNFLEAVAKFDAGDTVADTRGKNIVRWMVEDLGFEADPHAHETKYNYADVAYLHTRIGVKPSANAGGFLFLPPENPQGWEQHEDGIRGRRFPDYFWKADNLWGAGTFLHRGADERRHGMWRPKDGHNFYEHDASRRLAYIGGNCYSWAGMPADDMATLRTRLQELADSKLPKGFYTANTFVAQGRLTPELLDTMAAGLDSLKPFVEKGVLVWSPLTRTAERWKREYGGKPFQYECAPK